MPTTSTKLLSLYEDSLKSGKIPYGGGLCLALTKLEIPLDNLRLFNPSDEDKIELLNTGRRTVWWGADQSNNIDTLTPLRETVIGFLMAMEDNE